MNNLTKNVKTHYMLIKQGEKNEINKIPITKSQFDLYEEELQTKKHNDFFKIHDVETQEVLYNGRASKVEGFEEIKRDPTLQQRRWVCSFGTRHEMQGFPDNCECKHKFKTLRILFKYKLKELGYDVFYDSDITEAMQKHYLRDLK